MQKISGKQHAHVIDILFFANAITGKLQSLAHAQREQRREYRARLVDVDVELQRGRDRMEHLSMALDDLHVRKRENVTYFL